MRLRLENDRIRSDHAKSNEALGNLSEIPAAARETLATIPGLEQVLEDCIVCHDCLLKDIGEVSFGVMSYSCACAGAIPRKMHVNCIVSMRDLKCPLCQSPITIIAPSLMAERRIHRLEVAKTPGAQGEANDSDEGDHDWDEAGGSSVRSGLMSSAELASFQERVAAAAANLRRSMEEASSRASNHLEPNAESHRAESSVATSNGLMMVLSAASNRLELAAASTRGGPVAASNQGGSHSELAARASEQSGPSSGHPRGND